MNSLNTCNIVNKKEDILNALEGVDVSARDFVLINGCISKFILGGTELPLQFDKILFSETNKFLLFIMKDFELDDDSLKEFLQRKNIYFKELLFNGLEEDNYECNKNLKSFLFVNQKSTLKDAMINSKEKGIDKCTYYPNVFGSLELGYRTDDGNYGLIEKVNIDGVIETSDKIIMFFNKEFSDFDDVELYATLIDVPIKTSVDVVQNVKEFEYRKIRKNF